MKYTKASAEVVLFDNSDVVTASLGEIVNACNKQSIQENYECSWSSATGGSCNSRGQYNKM